MNRIGIWIGITLAAAVAAFLLLAVLPNAKLVDPASDLSILHFSADQPWLIGDAEDAFAYAGTNIQTIEGTVTLQIDQDSLEGMIEFSLPANPSLSAQTNGMLSASAILLRMPFSRETMVWADQPINKGSEVGEARLPLTQALFCGSGDFQIVLDQVAQPDLLPGFWSVGDALRQPDGSIRNQGLVFSPLLRDQSVFSDSSRTEFTLLLYAPSDPGTVLLHLVFPVLNTET